MRATAAKTVTEQFSFELLAVIVVSARRRRSSHQVSEAIRSLPPRIDNLLAVAGEGFNDIVGGLGPDECPDSTGRNYAVGEVVADPEHRRAPGKCSR